MAMTNARSATVDLPRMSRAASVVPGSLNEEARTVDVVWTTGAAVLRGYFEKYWEELSLESKHVRLKRLNNGAPFLNAHDDYSASDVLGVVEPGTAMIEKGRGIATIRFARAEDDPEADKIFRKIKDGILQNISVGYSTYKMEEAPAGKDQIKRFLATDWEPYELSVVPMGADDGAGFRSVSTERNPCVFMTRNQETKMIDPDETAPSNPTSGESVAVAATRAVNVQRVEDAKKLAAAREEAAQTAVDGERARMSGIRSIAKRSKLGDAWASKLIEAGTSVAEARDAAFVSLTDKDDEIDIDGHVRIGAGDDARSKFIRGASAWLFERTGTRRLMEDAKKKLPDLFGDVALDGGEFRGLSPVELARQSLERQGVSTRGMDRMRMIGQAFTHRGAYQTTSDFASLLENVLGKVLLGAYATQENTWERFCGTDQVPDFRTSNRYRTGSVTSLATIAEHGEYKNGVIPDASKYAISTERKGRIFALSREVLINDDMGALTNLAMEFGRASGRTIENAVYALLAENSGLGPTMSDSQPFFHANRANVNATSSALSVVGIDADRVVMRAQKDPSNLDYIDMNPAVLLVPDSLKGTAQVINDAQYDPDTANKLQRPNMVRGLFRDVIGTPRLSSTSTRRYLFADPMQAAAIVVAFLEGYGRGPLLESENGWRIDGVEWRVTLYAKAQVGDPKAAVTNAGT
jgi:HK97 family phage prohead protease